MSNRPPLIVAFVSNLLFESKIDHAVTHLGFELMVIDSVEKYGAPTQRERLGEPLNTGQTASLIRFLTEKQPNLLIFDLNNQQIPWQRWLPVIKTSPATRRLPVLVFGSHVEEEMLKSAESCGADCVVNNARFSTQMAALIKKHTKQYDFEAIKTACAEPLSALGQHGIVLFNAGAYFEAHELLEDAWNADKTTARAFYRALIQVAVAYLQIERGNYRGTIKMFLRVRQWLNQLPDTCHGVNLAQLRSDAEHIHSIVLALGATQITAFDMSQLQPIKLTN